VAEHLEVSQQELSCVRLRVCSGLSGCETWSLTVREEHKTEGVWEQGAEENIWTKEG
jgi:hypothetical protein